MADTRFDGYPTDARFPSPGVDNEHDGYPADGRFPSPGEDTRFGDSGPEPTPPPVTTGLIGHYRAADCNNDGTNVIDWAPSEGPGPTLLPDNGGGDPVLYSDNGGDPYVIVADTDPPVADPTANGISSTYTYPASAACAFIVCEGVGFSGLAEAGPLHARLGNVVDTIGLQHTPPTMNANGDAGDLADKSATVTFPKQIFGVSAVAGGECLGIVDGDAIGVGTALATMTFDHVRIGGHRRFGWPGRVYGSIWYERALTQAEFAQIRDWMKSEYGLA